MSYYDDFFGIPPDDYDTPYQYRKGDFRQPPTISRRIAKIFHDRENEIRFYEKMMRETTSYKSYASDDYGKPDKIKKWYEEVQRQNRERAELLQRLSEEHRHNEALRKFIDSTEGGHRT